MIEVEVYLRFNAGHSEVFLRFQNKPIASLIP